MIENVKNIIEYVGLGNVLSLILFLISAFIAFYMYFKTFYRLVYSIGRICKECNKITDWTSNETAFVTRVLFYNNGRKTITKTEIKKLELKSSNKIGSIKILKGQETLKTKTNKKQNIVTVDIEYLDSSDFFVLEVNHTGQLDVNGRISETGNLLHTEPRYWVLLHVFFIAFTFAMFFYHFVTEENPFTLKFIMNSCIIFLIFIMLRYVHSILFIPDRISTKYLDTKDKFAKSFKS